MAQGTDWNVGRTDEEAKAKLLEEVTKAVFKNDGQLTESDNIQRAVKDTIETIYGRMVGSSRTPVNGTKEYAPGTIGLGGVCSEGTTSVDSATGAENLFVGFNNPFSLYALVVNQSILRQAVTNTGVFSENISGTSYTINHSIDGIMDFGNIASLTGNTAGFGSKLYLSGTESYIDFNSNNAASNVKVSLSGSGIITTYGAGTGAGTAQSTLSPGQFNTVFDGGGNATGELFINPGIVRIDTNGGINSRNYLEINGGNIIMGGFNNAGANNINLFGSSGFGFLMTTDPFSTVLPPIDSMLVVDGTLRTVDTITQGTANAATDTSFLVTRDQGTGELQQTPNPTSIATFTNTVGISTINLTREVFGDQIRLTGELDVVAGVSGGIRNTINDVIPQDFMNKKWFKLTRVTMVMEDTAVAGGQNGYFELDEVSSYQSGVLQTDITVLNIPGNAAGITRAYDIDGFNQTQGPINGMVDRVEDLETDNYIQASPKDLTLSAFNFGWIDNTQAVADYAVTSNNDANGFKIRFVIEGYLM